MLQWLLPNSFRGNYNFHIEIQPKTIESNSNITLTCYSNKNKGAVIPTAINWLRLRNGLATNLAHVRGNTYMCDPSDVGAIIRAEIRSLDQESAGNAVVDLGPIRIDLITKKNIETILSTGVGNFTVFMVGRTRDREANLRINDGVMRLKDVLTENCYKFEYSVTDPRIDINPKDNTRIQLRFSERYQEDLVRFLQATFQEDMPQIKGRQLQYDNGLMPSDTKLELRFTSRTTRDMLIFSYRAFVASRQIKTAHLLKKVENLNLNEQDTFNFLLEVETLKSEIARLMEVNRDQTREKELYHREIKRLEEEMERIILTYTKIVEEKCRNQIDFNQSYSILTNKREEVISKKQRGLEADNRELTQRNRLLLEELEYLKYGRIPGEVVSPGMGQQSFTKKSIPPQDMESKVHQLSRINSYNERRPPKQKSIDNLLDSLNESAVRESGGVRPSHNIEQLNESLMALHNENISIAKKLQATARKNDELEQIVAQQAVELHNSRAVSNGSNQASRVQSVHKLHPSHNAQSMFVESGDAHRLATELAELRKVNDRLSHQNGKLQASRKSELSQCQNLQSEVSELKEELRAEKNRSQYTVVLESSELQKTKAEAAQLGAIKLSLEKKCEALLRECLELKQRIKSLELDLECERTNSRRLLEANTPEIQRLTGELSSLHSRLAERQRTIATLQSSLKRSRESVLNGSSTSEEPSRLRKKMEELQEENKLLKQRQNVMNKSRDLSMEMDSFYEQENNIVKQQLAMLTQQNEGLVRMVEKYSKEAKETTKLRMEIIQLRQENMELKREIQARSLMDASVLKQN